MIKESKNKILPKNKYYVIYDAVLEKYFGGGVTSKDTFTYDIFNATHYSTKAEARYNLNRLANSYFSIIEIYNNNERH